MDVPQTVRTALADQHVEGAVCLEAGAGHGNTTCGLLERDAAHVFAVTNDREDAAFVRDRVDASHRSRTTVLYADLRAIPLPADSVEFVTAHALFNLVSPPELDGVLREMNRVAAPGCRLVVNDYEPLPPEAAMRDVFAMVNAASEVADGRTALTFYPAELLRRTLAGRGWAFERRRTLLDPVPWTESHVRAYVELVREASGRMDEPLGAEFRRRAERVSETIGPESAGEMYSLAFRYPPAVESREA